MLIDQPELPPRWQSHPLGVFATHSEVMTIQGFTFACVCETDAEHWADRDCTCVRVYFEPTPVRRAMGRFVLQHSCYCTFIELLAVRDAARLALVSP